MKRKKAKAITMITLSLALLLTACGAEKEEKKADTGSSKSSESSKSSSDESDKVFGTFESETLEGEAVSDDIFSKADLTMVNIWGTFCGPCIREMPDLGELSREYAEKGVQIVGLVSDVGEAKNEKAEEIVSTTKADYTHIIASQDLMSGILSSVNVVPTTIFVDKDGNQVGEVYSGARDKAEWAGIIDKLLGEI
ncbi:TlpA family protein disulfide reductase [Extibacter muris]|nr:TlpA disulfide reductase family protein [Extibacter muris]MCB6201896.1 TlpA family protein disulfide reductase [Extibacter muris]MCQ4663233.1 TlpA family protein disulfide reductase [Extibacter muris]MCQ4692489.1 TlpA family protein disulfide reductase [Extibacter muris]